MSELRWNPVLQEWVITATHRQDRTFFPPPEYCPLCPTKPGAFPTEIPMEDYDIVVFENKFPSLRSIAPDPAVTGTELSPIDRAEGVCEVVCYTSDHNTELAKLPLKKIHNLVRVWVDRFEDLGSRDYVDYVFIFENKGKEIGVTLSHPHGQIYAYPYLPPRTTKMLEVASAHKNRTGRVLMDDIVVREMKDQVRIISQNEEWVAYVPYASRYPFEIHLAPKKPVPDLAALSDYACDAFPSIAKEILLRLDASLI